MGSGIYINIEKTDKRSKSRSIIHKAECKVCGKRVEGGLSYLKGVKTCRHGDSTAPKIKYSEIKDKSIVFILQGIWKRCYRPYEDSYPWYGAKGIRLCDKWIESPALFEEWVNAQMVKLTGSPGWKHGWSIDRIDSSRDYSPENCRVITVSENCKDNGRAIYVTFDGVTLNTSDWARALGKSRGYLNHIRSKKGDDAVYEYIRQNFQKMRYTA